MTIDLRRKTVGAANIFLAVGMDPEDEAMAQALYSRSALSVQDHVKKVEEVGSGKFMESYYVGYGHKSIGDCGTTTLFFENVSLLAAKAVQQWPLYSGQETSTRYLDMGTRPVVDNTGHPAVAKIIDALMDFYRRLSVELPPILRLQRPYTGGTPKDARDYEKAIAARTFDIARGWLPAGVTTQLSWHSNFRQLADHLEADMGHPLKEVRDLFQGAHELLRERFPSSFREPRQSSLIWSSSADQLRELMQVRHLHAPYRCDIMHYTSNDTYEQVLRMLGNRDPRSPIPYCMGDVAVFHLRGALDFGSLRDIQRHRNRLPAVPLLTPDNGYESWYFGQLPSDLYNEAESLHEEVLEAYMEAKRSVSLQELQYMLPLYFVVPVEAYYPLDSFIYLMELRGTPFVHPTLRNLIRDVYKALKPELKEVIQMDQSETDWDLRRGAQDIREK